MSDVISIGLQRQLMSVCLICYANAATEQFIKLIYLKLYLFLFFFRIVTIKFHESFANSASKIVIGD